MAARLAGWALLVGTILFVAQLPTSQAADAPPDVSKLKKGDALEVHMFGDWNQAKFIERVSDRIIRVEIPSKRIPFASVMVDKVRLTGAAAPSFKPRGADDPFATEEEKAQFGGTRTWTAANGKSTVEATLLRVDGAAAVLRRSDGKEVTVPLDKLSAGDRKYVADVQSGKANPRPGSDAAGAPSAADSELPLTATDLSEATQIQVSADNEWRYVPTVDANSKLPKSIAIALRPSPDIFEKVEQLLLLPSAGKAMVSMRHSPPVEQATSRLQVVNLTRRQLEDDIPLPDDVVALATSPDGSLLVARTDGFGFGNNSELRLYRMADKALQLTARWTPFQSAAAAGGHKTDVFWASFVDSQLLMTLSRGGQLAAWKLPELKPVYSLQVASQVIPALHGGNVAVLTESHVAIFRAADGESLGAIALDGNDGFSANLAFSEDGSKLAARQAGRLRVWDLKRRELWRDFALPGYSYAGSIGWSGDLLGIDGSMIVDPERRVPLTKSAQPVEVMAVVGDAAWAIKAGHAQRTNELVAGPIVPKGFKNPLAKMTADELLAVKPGIEVAVELNVGDQQTKELVTSRLQSQGFKIVPQSNVRLVGNLTSGPTKTQNYRRFGSAPFRTTEVQVTRQILTLSWMVGSDEVWSTTRNFGAPLHLRMEPGESMQQAVDRASRANPEAFASMWVPAFVAVAPKQTTALPRSTGVE